MVLRFLDKYRDIGLLILRVGIGVMFMIHGLPKLTGGPEKWEMLGGTMKSLGVGFAPMVWGFMAAFSECAGGLLLVLGFFTRPACFFLLTTMIVAVSMHISKGDPFVAYSHAMEAGILFISLILIGPGKYSIDGQHKQARH
ncbi:MAG: DoxX family protein [Candidatus Scalindua sp.]